MLVPAIATMTPEEFLAWERTQPQRHHYVEGEVYAMAGGSPRHNRLAAKAIVALTHGLGGSPCGVYSSDQKLGLLGEQFVYADAVVLCPPLVLRPGTTDVVSNPSVVVEVLSPGTEAYDRGKKQRAYLALPSLRHLLFVSQTEVSVDLYSRQTESAFRYEMFAAGETARLVDPALTFSIDELYAGVFDVPGD